ncbi:MAG: pantoate--beta-alanine ligase [Flavobacteriales bacterium]|nr:pantoate--beta-alanine ligase [Flavobacteriales bacterium]
MEILTAPEAMAGWSANARRNGQSVGFVPTMGALHAGHAALVERALLDHGAVACSIFVNPLQFNDPTDLRNYPRTLEADVALLSGLGCSALFMPSETGIYANHQPRQYDLGGLDRFWEGPSRPGHFQGVVNVVERLFHYVRPDAAYFGEKDRQQLAIIRHVARSLRWPEHIVPCATVRDPDGLALSSRNARLSDAERAEATILHMALRMAGELAFRAPVQEVLDAMSGMLARSSIVAPDHIGIVDEDSLEPITEWGVRRRAVALIAAQVGPVRLIDNLTLEA